MASYHSHYCCTMDAFGSSKCLRQRAAPRSAAMAAIQAITFISCFTMRHAQVAAPAMPDRCARRRDIAEERGVKVHARMAATVEAAEARQRGVSMRQLCALQRHGGQTLLPRSSGQLLRLPLISARCRMMPYMMPLRAAEELAADFSLIGQVLPGGGGMMPLLFGRCSPGYIDIFITRRSRICASRDARHSGTCWPPHRRRAQRAAGKPNVPITARRSAHYLRLRHEAPFRRSSTCIQHGAVLRCAILCHATVISMLSTRVISHDRLIIYTQPPFDSAAWSSGRQV